MWQARHVAALLHKQNPTQQLDIIPISTAGDTDKTTPLSELGGKGVFVRGLEEALIDNHIDIAVHSLKDVTSQSLEGLSFFAFLTPESIQDALVTKKDFLPRKSAQTTLDLKEINAFDPISTLPQNSRIGTGSLRRIALLRRLRPDLQTIPIRGNIETRMQKVLSGELEGILLSEAGLKRMGVLGGLESHALSPEQFTPAPGQGVITVQGRESDFQLKKQIELISDPIQSAVSTSQLALLKLLGFDCRDPFGIWSYPTENGLTHHAFLETNPGNGRIHTFHTSNPATVMGLQTWVNAVSKMANQ
jgi:hydroxymethylbilane synthase